MQSRIERHLPSEDDLPNSPQTPNSPRVVRRKFCGRSVSVRVQSQDDALNDGLGGNLKPDVTQHDGPVDAPQPEEVNCKQKSSPKQNRPSRASAIPSSVRSLSTSSRGSSHALELSSSFPHLRLSRSTGSGQKRLSAPPAAEYLGADHAENAVDAQVSSILHDTSLAGRI
jgi:hypothetical protein